MIEMPLVASGLHPEHSKSKAAIDQAPRRASHGSTRVRVGPCSQLKEGQVPGAAKQCLNFLTIAPQVLKSFDNVFGWDLRPFFKYALPSSLEDMTPIYPGNRVNRCDQLLIHLAIEAADGIGGRHILGATVPINKAVVLRQPCAPCSVEEGEVDAVQSRQLAVPYTSNVQVIPRPGARGQNRHWPAQGFNFSDGMIAMPGILMSVREKHPGGERIIIVDNPLQPWP
mmetsp:Transcript_114998/g.245602  ORF Transcript_114998/g.245602 Transcript_114998/m.245602 type:complete len:226 (+) Transcript_114998:162-839(+)